MTSPQSLLYVLKPTREDSETCFPLPLTRTWHADSGEYAAGVMDGWETGQDAAAQASLDSAGLTGRVTRFACIGLDNHTGRRSREAFVYPAHEMAKNQEGVFCFNPDPVFFVMDGLHSPSLLSTEDVWWVVAQKSPDILTGADYLRMRFARNLRHMQNLLKDVDDENLPKEVVVDLLKDSKAYTMPWGELGLGVELEYYSQVKVGSLELNRAVKMILPDGSDCIVTKDGLHASRASHRDADDKVWHVDAGRAC